MIALWRASQVPVREWKVELHAVAQPRCVWGVPG